MRLNNRDLLIAIVTGYDIDRSPTSIAEWVRIMNYSCTRPVNAGRVSRNLWMLAHTGFLGVVGSGDAAVFEPTQKFDKRFADEYWRAI